VIGVDIAGALRTFRQRAMYERLIKTPLVQPPDAENRMSGGVGGWPGAIPATRPDRGVHSEPTTVHARLSERTGDPPPHGKVIEVRVET
jgi:hypothetical protein